MTRGRPVGLLWLGVVFEAALAAACGLDMAGELVPPGHGPNAGSEQDGGRAADATLDDDSTTAASGEAFADLDSSENADGTAADGTIPSVPCNFTGTWGTELTIPVNWVPEGVMGVILAPGSGTISQWTLATRQQSGTTLSDTTIVCGIVLPDFQGTSVAGGETYGVRFPDSLFDDGGLPSFTVTGTVSAPTSTATYTTSLSAALLGIALADPTTAPWPSWQDALADFNTDGGSPGVTAYAAQGSPYEDFPVNIDKSPRADSISVVIRQVTQLSGAATDCDHITGSVSIPQITDSSGTSKYAIDSHVVGCELDGDAGACNLLESNFLDSTQPIFSPSGGSTFTSIRMAAGATCASVRSALP